VLVSRAVGRRICKNCGATYHVENNKPKVDGVCDKCGGELYQRSDDVAETVENRISVYMNETMPLINYYDAQNKLVNIEGEQNINDVFSDIVDALKG
jgi:adenylate kinase